MKLNVTKATQTARILTSGGIVATVDYIRSNYGIIHLVATATDVDEYDSRFDVYFNMSDDGDRYYDVFHALDEGVDGAVDMKEYVAASAMIRNTVTQEIYINKNPSYNRHDVPFMMEVLSNPAWTYRRFLKLGNWTLALHDALKVFDHSGMMTAMMTETLTMLSQYGVTSVKFDDDI
jgi:hypothetical protein